MFEQNACEILLICLCRCCRCCRCLCTGYVTRQRNCHGKYVFETKCAKRRTTAKILISGSFDECVRLRTSARAFVCVVSAKICCVTLSHLYYCAMMSANKHEQIIEFKRWRHLKTCINTHARTPRGCSFVCPFERSLHDILLVLVLTWEKWHDTTNGQIQTFRYVYWLLAELATAKTFWQQLVRWCRLIAVLFSKIVDEKLNRPTSRSHTQGTITGCYGFCRASIGFR